MLSTLSRQENTEYRSTQEFVGAHSSGNGIDSLRGVGDVESLHRSTHATDR